MLPPRALIAVGKFAGLGALIGALTAFLQHIPIVGPPGDFTVLPTSIVGYLGLIVAFFAAADAIHRRLNDPSEKMGKALIKKIEDVEEAFDERATRIEQDIIDDRRATTERVTEYRLAVKEWTARLTEIEIVGAVAANDIGYMRTGIDDIKKMVERRAHPREEHHI